MDSDINPLRDNFAKMLAQVKEAHATWIASLVEQYPQLADKLWQHHERFCDRNAKLEGLPLLLTLDPALPLQQMYREYNAQFDTRVDRPVKAEADDVESGRNPRLKGAVTKRIRTREALIAATADLIMKGGEFRLEDVAQAANVGTNTVYMHFGTKKRLLDAAYERLLVSILNTS